jgi:hypothetical protein
MTLEEFNNKLKELDDLVATVLTVFEEQTGIYIETLLVTTDKNGDYQITTGLDFPESFSDSKQ